MYFLRGDRVWECWPFTPTPTPHPMLCAKFWLNCPSGSREVKNANRLYIYAKSYGHLTEWNQPKSSQAPSQNGPYLSYRPVFKNCLFELHVGLNIFYWIFFKGIGHKFSNLFRPLPIHILTNSIFHIAYFRRSWTH